MKKILSNIRDFFYLPVPAESLAFFRIAISAFALVQVLVLLPDWMWYFGANGLVPWEVSDPLSTTRLPTLLTIKNLLSRIPVSANGVVYAVTGIYMLSLAGLLLGYKTRLTGFLSWLMHGILSTTGHLTSYGVETFTHISLFYCMILPVGVRWSMDNRNRKTKVPDYLVTLGVRLIQLHLCIMYFTCGIEKASGTQWWNGEAIWIAMQQDQFHKININWMAQFPLLPKLLCWSTLLVETLYPLGMLFKKSRKFWLLSILSMHTFIAIFLGLYLFGTLMILLNITAFGHLVFPGLSRSKFSRLKEFPNAFRSGFYRLTRIDSIL